MYLFSQSKHGVAAKELERHLGISYRHAWRMGHQIRALFIQEGQLKGIVEIDEAYVGGRWQRLNYQLPDKTPVMGMVERGGRVRATVLPVVSAYTLQREIYEIVEKTSIVYSDGLYAYRGIEKAYEHEWVGHREREYVRGEVYTNNIESFWSHLKGPINVTYRGVSARHLQKYVDEAVWRHNHRADSFSALLSKAGQTP